MSTSSLLRRGLGFARSAETERKVEYLVFSQPGRVVPSQAAGFLLLRGAWDYYI